MKLNKFKENFKKISHKLNLFFAKYFSWIILLSVIIVFALGYKFLISPKYQAINEISEVSMNKKEKEYIEKRKEFNDFIDLINVYNNINSEHKKKINAMLSTEDVHEEIFTRLESIISRNGFIPLSIDINLDNNKKENISEKEDGAENDISGHTLLSKIGKVEVELEVAGINYSGLKSLLQDFENSLRIIDVENIVFSPDKETVDFNLSTYYLKNNL